MPTTTANFADLTLVPSTYLLGALATLYASALFLLFLAVFFLVLPLSILIACSWLLWHEYWQLALRYCQQQGRLVIEQQGQIRWQGERWRLVQVKICTRWLIMVGVQSGSQRRWLLIAPDSCRENDYRSLALFCHHFPSICHD
ncbi:protein YgfX [Photobacterium sanctipauli]|uniref:protein YgfX n=1 Tax=Photobacterium sanctipauli TaxID=1342794 RepID=UPI0013048B71|nr:protein YgfX [Photobacterium sanctipauli]